MKTKCDLIKSGFTLIELLVVIAISGMLIVSVSSLISPALQAERESKQHNETLQQARFAMQQMVRMVSESERLMIPLAENPLTLLWSESVRDVLAVTMPHGIDRDKDGWADVDNDKDGQLDEDVGADNNNDLAAGIYGIDDDNDGNIDESNKEDDDEDEDTTGNKDEDPVNGIDDDGDGSIDEDFPADVNGDGSAGQAGKDDDNDGSIDESNKEDDDEDEDETGNKDEDWFDTVVFFLNGTTLMQRIPNINPADGMDYGEYPIAENVSNYRVERILGGDGKTLLVDITLELTPPNADPVSVNTRVRLGGML